MSWSKITKILDAQAISTPGTNSYTSDVVRTQRYDRERGAFVSIFDAAPGSCTGTARMYGALSDDAPLAPVASSSGVAITMNQSDHNALTWGALLTNIPILPRVQFRTTDLTVLNARNLSLWLVE